MTNKLKVLIVDDHTMIRVALRNYFINDDKIEIVEEAVNGSEAFSKLNEADIDLILTDISMPEMDGYELTRRIKVKFPGVKVIALSMINESKQIERLINFGVDGYILKNCDREELKKGILQVMNGESYFSTNIVHRIKEPLKERGGNDLDNFQIPLSQREMEVLKLIMKEFSNSEIANELSISTRTVDAHKRNLFEKTGSKGLVGLVIYAVENELV